MLIRISVAFATVIMCLLTTAVPASASGPISCALSSIPDPGTGKCVLVVDAPGSSGSSVTDPARDKAGKRHGGGTSLPACMDNATGKKIACLGGPYDGYWSNAHQCYVSVNKDNLPKTDPAWEGHADGAVFDCFNPHIRGTAVWTFWAATRPAGPAAPPDPKVLASQAVAKMTLRAVGIGIVPEDKPGKVGIIGFPQWMWVQNPGPTTMGPVTRTASAGGYTVTATAIVDHLVWNMGDGNSVTCNGPGTPYEDRFGAQDSSTCGYRYAHPGDYTVTATSYWTVEWAGIGQTGTIPLTFTNTTHITMGEVQVLTQ